MPVVLTQCLSLSPAPREIKPTPAPARGATLLAYSEPRVSRDGGLSVLKQGRPHAQGAVVTQSRRPKPLSPQSPGESSGGKEDGAGHCCPRGHKGQLSFEVAAAANIMWPFLLRSFIS